MADTEILNVLLKLQNPEVFDRLEKLKNQNFTVNVSVKGDGSFKALTELQDKRIKITADAKSAIEAVTQIRNSLASIGLSKEIKLNLTGDVVKDLEKANNLLTKLQLQSKNINTVGISNEKANKLASNPALLDQALKSFSSQQFANKQITERDLDSAISNARARNNVAGRNSGIEMFQKKSGAVQLPLGEVKGYIQQRQNDAFQQQIAIANRQLQEQAAAKAQQAMQKRLQEQLTSKKELGGLLTELGIGAIGGSSKPLALGGSLLGGLAGAAFGPGGAILGGQVGGALGEGASKSLETLAGALEDVTRAGIEFQKTIVALTGVFQANTDVIGQDGKALSVQDQVRFNTQQAKGIQKSARAGLLPLGIGGEAEATLVQGLVSGFSQRGIILDAEQTKTVSSRIGAAIVALAPQILQNTVQERKDVEDIAANSPNAKRTTLGVALKSIAPDLFRPLASGDEIVKATARLEQFVQAIKNSDQASVQLLRLSGALDKIRTTTGDSFLQGLQPGLKSLADVLNSDDLTSGLEVFGTVLGGTITIAIKAVTPLIDKFGQSLSAFAENVKNVFPGLAKFIEGPEQIAAQSKAKAEREIFGKFTSLGIETPLEDFDKTVRAEPNERLANIRDLQATVGSFDTPELTGKFTAPLVELEQKALRETLDKQLSLNDTTTLPGRRDSANQIINNGAERLTSLNGGLSVARFQFKQAQESQDINEQSRQSSIINQFQQEQQEVVRAQSSAFKELVNATLDERKAIQTVRNAQEGLADAQKQQELRVRDLTRSLQEATDAVTTFATKAESAFASKEEQVLQAAKAVEDAGGPSLIGNIDERLAEAKLRSASTSFNELSVETGLGITAPEAAGARISRIGTPFANAIESQGQSIDDTLISINEEIDKLPRTLRDLTESLGDLLIRTKELFSSEVIPTEQPDFPATQFSSDLFAPLKTEELKKITTGINDNPINFSDNLIARPSMPSRAYNPILREGLNEGLGNKSDAKTNAVLEDVVGGFLDADVDGLKKQNRAPASGLKNGLFSGGLFGDREDVKSGKGTAESNFADSVGAKIDENFNKLGDIISKALGGAL